LRHVLVTIQLDEGKQQRLKEIEFRNEGKQYRWGNIEVGLDPKMETRLKSQLKMGSPVNPKLIEVSCRDNKSVLASGRIPQKYQMAV
jgi:hypothetical protein